MNSTTFTGEEGAICSNCHLVPPLSGDREKREVGREGKRHPS